MPIIITIMQKSKIPSTLDNLIGRILQFVPNLGQGDVGHNLRRDFLTRSL